jgi:hypothetical protein
VSDHGEFFLGVRLEVYAKARAAAITISGANPSGCFALIRQTRFNRGQFLQHPKELQCATWTAKPQPFY